MIKQKLEDDSRCAETTTNNKNLLPDNLGFTQTCGLRTDHIFVIEIDDNNDDDLEILYSRYPSNEYEISSFDKIIKDENNNNNIDNIHNNNIHNNIHNNNINNNNNNNSKNATAHSEALNDTSRPKTYKVTIIKRDSNQQRKFRIELLNHYRKCIITGLSWPVALDAAHIMPFKQVGSSLNTGFLLRRDIHSLWDRFHISIDSETWTVLLSEEASVFRNYSKYNKNKISRKTVDLLKKADIQILKQHYDKFKEMECSRKYKIQNILKIPNKKINKRALARSKNQKDEWSVKAAKLRPENKKIIMYYVDFISQIWKDNDNTKEWFKPSQDIPKIIIYSAFVQFNNKKNGKSLSENDFNDQKKKVFWQNMYNVICKSSEK
jgi:hypothetical protein